jgi:phenylacetate-CoA ligase
MIRYWSGDLTTWTDEPCECGRTYPRLPKGIYGRVDDMVIIRGHNVYPSAIEEILRGIPGFGEEFRMIVSRQEVMDKLVVQAEYNHEAAETGRRNPGLLPKLRRQMEERLKALIGVRAVVQLTPPGTLPRTEFKARRVMDNRELFEEFKKTE